MVHRTIIFQNVKQILGRTRVELFAEAAYKNREWKFWDFLVDWVEIVGKVFADDLFDSNVGRLSAFNVVEHAW